MPSLIASFTTLIALVALPFMGPRGDLNSSSTRCQPAPCQNTRAGRAVGANTDPESIRRVYSIDKSPARRSCWIDGGGGAGVVVADFSYCGDFRKLDRDRWAATSCL
jgi:hypothetical protein